MEYTTVQELMARRGVPYSAPRIFMDPLYVNPTKEWATIINNNAFRQNLTALNLTQYVDLKWNCNKFSRAKWALSSIAFALTPGNEGKGLATGLFNYMAPFGAHEITFDICGPTPDDIVFTEPQTQKQVELSDKEIQSCFGYII